MQVSEGERERDMVEPQVAQQVGGVTRPGPAQAW